MWPPSPRRRTRRARKSLSWLLALSKRGQQNGGERLRRHQAYGGQSLARECPEPYVQVGPMQRRNGWSKQKQASMLLGRVANIRPQAFEREMKSLILQTKGDDPLAQMARDAARKLKRENPEEYTRRALEALKPRKVTQDGRVACAHGCGHGAHVAQWPRSPPRRRRAACRDNQRCATRLGFESFTDGCRD